MLFSNVFFSMTWKYRKVVELFHFEDFIHDRLILMLPLGRVASELFSILVYSTGAFVDEDFPEPLDHRLAEKASAHVAVVFLEDFGEQFACYFGFFGRHLSEAEPGAQAMQAKRRVEH